MNALDGLPVVVIGAGPVGLAAAAHLHERGLPFTVLEAGDTPGRRGTAVGARAAVLAVAVQHRPGRPSAPRRRRLGRPRPGAPAHRRGAGRRLPPAPRGRCRSSSRTCATAHASRRSAGSAWTGCAPPAATPRPFLLRLADGDELLARAVIDASGTWATPNVLGASGLRRARRGRRGAASGARAARRARRRPGPVRRPAHPRGRRRPLGREHPARPWRSWPPPSPAPR